MSFMKADPADHSAASHSTTSAEPTSTTDNGNTKEHDALKPTSDHTEYPTGIKLALLLTSVFVSMFLVSLVSTNFHAYPRPATDDVTGPHDYYDSYSTNN